MSRGQFSFVIGIALAACALLYALTPSKADELMQKEMFNPSIQLNGNCSGTLVYSNRDQKTGEATTYVLTARHCTEELKGAVSFVDMPRYDKNRIVGYDRVMADIKAQDYASDLTLMVLKDKTRVLDNVAKIADADMLIEMGDPVWVVGHPLAGARRVTTGLFGSAETLDYPKAGTEYYTATGDIAPGNSGGAMFAKDKSGGYVLIGVTQVGYQNYSFLAFFGTREAIREFLGRVAPEVLGKAPRDPMKIGSN